MVRISQGKIRLEDRIIDLSKFEVRKKVSERDLETYYASFLDHIDEARDYFEDENAFDKAVSDAAGAKKPKLVAREPKYPFMYPFRILSTALDILRPSKRRLNDDYFTEGHCITDIPGKRSLESDTQAKPVDMELRRDIVEKFKQYPGYEGIIEIPNDRTAHQTKSTTFHEALHYIINRYQAETGRRFVKTFARGELSPVEKYQAEHNLHERAVEILTDKLLVHDPEAQFETRWLHHSMENRFNDVANMVSAMSTMLTIGFTAFGAPYLLPLALVPGRVRDYAINRHKQSKKGEMLKPVEYPKFKI